MFPYPLKKSIDIPDVLTEGLILAAILVLIYFLTHQIALTHNRGRLFWFVALVGAIAYAFGESLDLLDEFFKVPQIFKHWLENGFISTGVILLLGSAVVITRDLRIQAAIDPLTGLYNRRYLYRRFDEEIMRSVRHNMSLAVLFLDLDRFKEINDRFGHAAGDAVLRKVSAVLQTTVRLSDIVARYGGDEFVVILPGMDATGVENVRRRICLALKDLWPQNIDMNQPSVGVSCGVALFPADGRTATELLAVADHRAYADKRTCPTEKVVSNSTSL